MHKKSGWGMGLLGLCAWVAGWVSAPSGANPTAPQVISGSAQVPGAGTGRPTITNTPNWQSFSIGAGDVSRFVQQSSASAVLNAVPSGANPTAPQVINGS